jgi:BlaI family transcriptional regulator, penicillinase repressor
LGLLATLGVLDAANLGRQNQTYDKCRNKKLTYDTCRIFWSQRTIDMKKSGLSVTELELSILQQIWARQDQATVNEILESWPGKKPGYTTILKTLQKMEAKGIVSHRQDGKRYFYFPLLKREHVTENRLKAIVGRIFSGNKISFAEYFINSSDLNMDEILELKKIIINREKDLKK